jgi:hemerythrin superfamily protein
MKFTDIVPKGIFANSSGDDAVSLLTADHDKVQELFKQFDEIKDVTDARGLQEKQRIVAAACAELTVHTRLEEEIFYPAVRGIIDDADLMNEAQVEHDGAKALIGQLGDMTAKNEMFNAKFTVLAEYVKHHIKEEQTEMFPKVRSGDVDLVQLGQRMAARKQELAQPTPPAKRRAPVKKQRPAVHRKARAATQCKPATRRSGASAKL